MKHEAFELENKRNELAKKGNTRALQKLYFPKLPEISDENSNTFWNKRFKTPTPFKDADSMTKDRIKTVISFIPKSAKKILDIGIGNAWVEERISKRNLKLYGFDISDTAIKNVKKKLKGKYSIQSIYDFKYKKSYFDTILLLEVLEHIPPSKTFFVLNKIKDLLKPGGYLIISIPTNEGLEKMKGNPNGHLRMYTVPLIRFELTNANFSLVKIKTLYAFKKYYKLKRIVAKFLNRWKPNNIIILARKNT